MSADRTQPMIAERLRQLAGGMLVAAGRIEALEAELAICRPKAAAFDECSSKIDCISRGALWDRPKDSAK